MTQPELLQKTMTYQNDRIDLKINLALKNPEFFQLYLPKNSKNCFILHIYLAIVPQQELLQKTILNQNDCIDQKINLAVKNPDFWKFF